MEWYTMAFTRWSDFGGRSRRKEYWMFFLINLIISVVLAGIEQVLGIGSFISGIYSLVVLIPSLALLLRRLHDTGRSGWWALIVLIPLIGALALLFFLIQDGEPGENQYGPNPKEKFFTP